MMNNFNSPHQSNVIISVPLNQTSVPINNTEWNHCNGNAAFSTNGNDLNINSLSTCNLTPTTSMQFNTIQFATSSTGDQHTQKVYVAATQNNINNNNHVFPQNTQSTLLPVGFQNSISATARILPKPKSENQSNFDNVIQIQQGINQQQHYLQNVNPVSQYNVESTLNESIQSIGDNKGKLERIYPCPSCAKQFKRGDHLKRHLITVHDHEHPYKCGGCSKGFVSVSSLLAHVETSHKTSNKMGHLCFRCDLTFMDNKIFEAHSKSLHELEDADYMRKINKSSRTFSCEICQKTVSSEKNLKRHIKKLHGEKGDNKLMCVKCDQVFTSSLNVQEHMKQVHPEDKFVIHTPCTPSVKPEVMQSRPQLQHTFPSHDQIVLHKPEQLAISSHSYVPYSLPNNNYLNTNISTKQMVCQPQEHQLVTQPQRAMPIQSINVSANQMAYQPQERQVVDQLQHSMPVQSTAISANQIVYQPQEQQLMAQQQQQQQQHSMNMQNATEEVKMTNSEWTNQSTVNILNSLSHTNCGQLEIPTSTSNQGHAEVNNTMGPMFDSCQSIDLGVTSTTDTVSEAFSIAMKTLSDFSCYDLSINTQDYLQVVPAVFQPNSPLPIFHNPHQAPLTPNPVPMDVAVIPQAVEKSMIYPPQMTQPYPDVTSNVIPEATSQKKAASPPIVNITPHPPLGEKSEATPMVQARRGRPKKRRRREDGTEEEDDLYGTQSMIIKEGEDEESQKFNCTVCNQMFMGIDSLMQHVESIHLSVNPHECCICNKRFAQAGNVKRHIRFVHLRERPFRCRECDSTFDRLCYLQRHMRSHIDTKVSTTDTSHLNPCNCPECGKRCLTAHHLRGHMQRKHFAKNKKKSGEFMQKYSHLFVESEPILGAKELDHYGRPIKPVTKPNYANKKHLNNNKHVVENHKQLQPQPVVGNQLALVMNNQQNEANYWNEIMESNTSQQNIYNNNGMSIPNFQSQVMSQPIQQHISPTSNNNFMNNVTNSYNPNPANSNEMRFDSKLHEKRQVLKKTNRRKATSQRHARKSLFPFKCQHCPNRNFSALSLLKSHVVVKHLSTTNRHICIKCGRNYCSRNRLMVHRYRHHKTSKTEKKLPSTNHNTAGKSNVAVVKEVKVQFSQMHRQLTAFDSSNSASNSYPVLTYGDHVLPHSQSIVQS